MRLLRLFRPVTPEVAGSSPVSRAIFGSNFNNLADDCERRRIDRVAALPPLDILQMPHWPNAFPAATEQLVTVMVAGPVPSRIAPSTPFHRKLRPPSRPAKAVALQL